MSCCFFQSWSIRRKELSVILHLFSTHYDPEISAYPTPFLNGLGISQTRVCGDAVESACCPCAVQDSLDAIVDMKEHDVPYHIRFCIDVGVRCGHWFNVTAKVMITLLCTSSSL